MVSIFIRQILLIKQKYFQDKISKVNSRLQGKKSTLEKCIINQFHTSQLTYFLTHSSRFLSVILVWLNIPSYVKTGSFSIVSKIIEIWNRFLIKFDLGHYLIYLVNSIKIMLSISLINDMV